MKSVAKKIYFLDRQTRARVSECWAGLRGTTPSDAVRIFLNTARKWPLCGSSMFLAKVSGVACLVRC